MNRYKEKSKFDEERFLKEDEGYLLKESRPIKPNAIRRLNKAKMFQFIEDMQFMEQAKDRCKFESTYCIALTYDINFCSDKNGTLINEKKARFLRKIDRQRFNNISH